MCGVTQKKRGVQRVEGIVESAIQAPSGDISALKMLNGTEIHGDFFIDCSGTAGVLIDKVLGVPLVDWSDNLPCDRAVTCQTKSAENWAPYTTSVARDAGWTWEIPLQNRVGNGYVYSSVFCDDETAQNTLLQSISGEIITEPKFISFSTGRRENIWYKNCLSLGLSSGFVEPLESTAIHLVMKGVRTFVDLLPKKTASPVLANEYNRLMNSLYDDVRDFVILHYCTSNRTDSEFFGGTAKIW
nr:tryptophan 7-halogenase [Teredinibacter purpureus]